MLEESPEEIKRTPYSGSAEDGDARLKTPISSELRQYRVFDERLLLMCESPSMTTQIHTFLKALEIPVDEWAGPTVRLAIFNAPRDHVILCCPEGGTARVFAAGRPAWAGFRRLLLNFTLMKDRRHFPMHACGVADEEGRAALISGTSMSGKTTLTAALLQRGFRFVCDDIAQFQSDGRVLSYPTGSTVSERTFEFIPELCRLKSRVCRVGTHAQREWTLNFTDVFPYVQPYAALKVTHFFFVSPNFNGNSSIEPCSPAAAAWHFQNARMADRQILPPLRQGDPATYHASFSISQTLIEQARFYHLENGDLAAAADLIQNAIRN